MVLIFASNNKNKIKEFSNILAPYNITIKYLGDIGITEDIPETGNSFEENALIKAKYVFNKTGIPCISEDSGLCVDVLNGEPGIYSARYASNHDDKANNIKLLEKLKYHSNLHAHFNSTICYYDGNAKLFTGILNGTIATEERGINGFSYDTLFIPSNSNKTLAELTDDEKNSISHRKIAIEKFKEYIIKQ